MVGNRTSAIGAASIFAVAEVSLTGTWRWGAVALAALLSLYPWPEKGSVRFTVGRGATVSLLAGCFYITTGPIFIVLAALLLLNRRRADTIVSLSLAALGIHLLYWRYLSTLHVSSSLMQWSAAATSWVVGSVVGVLPEGVIVRGQTVRFSVVPIATVMTPTLVSLLAGVSGTPGSLLVRTILTILASVGSGVALSVVFELSGHVHFFAVALWPLVITGIGVLAAKTLLPLPQTDSASHLTIGRRWAVAVVLLGLGLRGGAVSEHRPLHIAFDEAHGKWETVNAPLNQVDYGRHTMYNFVLMRRWLETKHRITVLNSRWRNIDADVLIVKMPVEYYAAEEKLAIDQFVRRGGLLLVIGDHTNLYGTGLIINDLLRPYGLEIEASATVPWDSAHYDFRPAWWQRTRYLAGVSEIQFQTAGTIRARTPWAIPIVVADRVGGEDADYSNERFFGDLHPGPEDRQPPLVLAVERRKGQGRIVLFADSTVFSSFSFMSPGNVDIFQNFIGLGVSGRSKVRILLIILLLAGCLLLVRQRLWFALTLLPPLLAFSAYTASAERAPTPYPGAWINFDSRHSHLELRADPRDEHGPDYDDYSTFYAWIARTGMFPTVSARAFRDSHTPAIILNPDKPFSGAELDDIEHYVKQGGRLLVMDDARFAARSTVLSLLGRFGVGLSRSLPSSSLYDAGPPTAPANVFALPFELFRNDRRAPGRERARRALAVDVLTGVSPLLVDDRGSVIAGRKDIGVGSVVVFLRSTVFSEAVMGDVWVGSEVAPERIQLYQLEYDLVGFLRGAGVQ
jgi:hypothetical protein